MKSGADQGMYRTHICQMATYSPSGSKVSLELSFLTGAYIFQLFGVSSIWNVFLCIWRDMISQGNIVNSDKEFPLRKMA